MDQPEKNVKKLGKIGKHSCYKTTQQYDSQCQMSGLKMVQGQNATTESASINDFENDPKKVAELQ